MSLRVKSSLTRIRAMINKAFSQSLKVVLWRPHGYCYICRKILLDAPGKGKHDDVIKWKHFPRYWRFVWVILWSPVNSPHKGQWRGVSMFSLIGAWINGRVNTGEAGDLRRQRTHYDVIVMSWALWHLSEMLLNASGKGKNGLIIVSPWDLWYQYICNSRCKDSHLRSFVPVFRAQWILCWQYTPLATLIRG